MIFFRLNWDELNNQEYIKWNSQPNSFLNDTAISLTTLDRKVFRQFLVTLGTDVFYKYKSMFSRVSSSLFPGKTENPGNEVGMSRLDATSCPSIMKWRVLFEIEVKSGRICTEPRKGEMRIALAVKGLNILPVYIHRFSCTFEVISLTLKLNISWRTQTQFNWL